MDPQVTFLPSAEVLVKALVLISSAALATAPVSSMRILFCSHHPCVVGTAKRDAVWRVNVYQSIKIRIIYFVLCTFCFFFLGLLQHIFHLKAVKFMIILRTAIFLKF